MSSSDRLRGIGPPQNISRRDFINGVAATSGALTLPWSSLAADADALTAAVPGYPPARLGMRGSHPGSFEAAHALRDQPRLDLSSASRTGETYDLVVVGGGISGLAAAYYFTKNVGRSAKVLVLDNHDDFGGHAKRNELLYQGRLVAINGGTLEIESPSRYNQWAKQLLGDIGVDLDRYTRSNRSTNKLYRSLGLREAYFFDKETFGVDRLVVGQRQSGEAGAASAGFTPDFLRAAPISERAKTDLMRLEDPNQADYMPGLSSAQKKERLARMSYRDYLLNVAKIDEQAYWFYMATGRGVFCVGADATPALFAWQMEARNGGFSGLKLDPSPEGLLSNLPGGQHGRQTETNESVHFPDGNATLARLLVRWLIPRAVPGNSQEDVGTAQVRYDSLDRPENPARIRLNSTVLNVRHDGDADSAKEVIVSYSTSGRLYEVRARACVMACWNMFIPYLVPDLSSAQKEALAHNVKGPIVYTNVFLRNWRSFEKLGIESVNCPTMFHSDVALAEPCNLGSLRHPGNSAEPVALQMVRTPCSPGLPRKEQHRIGRAELLATSFETFEQKIRDQLSRILSAGGFDPDKDIVGIAVNRWPHGYSYTYNSLYDPLEWVFTETDSRPCVVARRPYGLITIANADAAASPHTDAAILEAHRAVTEIVDGRSFRFARRGSSDGQEPEKSG